MDECLKALKRTAEYLASKYKVPEFYSHFYHQHAKVRHIYFSDPLIQLVRERVEPELKQVEDLGHGLYHSRKVSWDCGTLLSIELLAVSRRSSLQKRLVILGIIAGLFHDICRHQDNHAEVGARKTAEILKDFPISSDEVTMICRAIRNHEAFVKPVPCTDPYGQLLSDCLYDADKFRWGIDTFTHTLWYMINNQKLTLFDLLKRFPWGIAGIQRISWTFRTPTGKQFGPEIIEQGVALGREIYQHLRNLVANDDQYYNYSH